LRILLVNPRSDHLIQTELPGHVGKELGHFPPLGLLYLAGYVRANSDHDVSLYDLPAEDATLDDLASRLKNERPDLVGISGITHNLASVKAVADTVKRTDAGIKVCFGGPHIAQFPAESIGLDTIDYTVSGEGEIPFLALLNALEKQESLEHIPALSYKQSGKTVVADTPAVTTDIENLPLPARDLVNPKNYFYILGKKATFATVLSSRGCPFKCTFCATTRGGYRTRSAKSVVDEMEECLAMGAEEIHFIDDTFNIRQERLADVSREILARNLKVRWAFRARADGINEEGMALASRAGCIRFHLGVEAGTEEGLKALKKGITLDQVNTAVGLARKYGIVSAAYFIIGCSYERSREDVLRTIEFAVRLNPDFAMFNILAIYPGTEIFDEAVSRGLLDEGFWRQFARNPDPGFVIPLWEEHLNRHQLDQLVKHAYRRFYFRPGPIWREVRSLTSLTEFKRKAGAALSILLGRN
jgi:anaerobic magnesium-protoporphyrin IX monomethyl ester cyclase